MLLTGKHVKNRSRSVTCRVVWSVLIVAIGRATRPITLEYAPNLEMNPQTMMFSTENGSRINPEVLDLLQPPPLGSMTTCTVVFWSVFIIAIGCTLTMFVVI